MLSHKNKEIRHNATYAWLLYCTWLPSELVLQIAQYVHAGIDNEHVVRWYTLVDKDPIKRYDEGSDSSVICEPRDVPYVVIETTRYSVKWAYSVGTGTMHELPVSLSESIVHTVDMTEFERLRRNGIVMFEAASFNMRTNRPTKNKSPWGTMQI
jgi:hypothetical protein